MTTANSTADTLAAVLARWQAQGNPWERFFDNNDKCTLTNPRLGLKPIDDVSLDTRQPDGIHKKLFKVAHLTTEFTHVVSDCILPKQDISRRLSIDVNTARSHAHLQYQLQRVSLSEPLSPLQKEVLTVSKRTRPLCNWKSPLGVETQHAKLDDGRETHLITQLGFEGWFEDVHIDMGFDFIARIIDCEKNKIALSNKTAANDLFMVGHKAAVVSDFPDTLDNYKAPHFDAELTKKFAAKDFILFPINDGYPSHMSVVSDAQIWTKLLYHVTGGPEEIKHFRGGHWSLIVVDCRGQSLKARYLDSLNQTADTLTTNKVVAWYLLQGLQLLLNKDAQHHRYDEVIEADFTVEPNAPHQGTHNILWHVESGSACGPFVWLMAKEFTQYIVDCNNDGKPGAIDLCLPQDFPQELRWDSQRTRKTIESIVKREIRVRQWLGKRRRWFDEIKDDKMLAGWKKWLEDRHLPLNYFWDPYGLAFEVEPWYEMVGSTWRLVE